MTLDRRTLMLSAGALALAWKGALAQPAPASIAPLFDRFMQERLDLNPESATNLGLDKGPDAARKSRLNDKSEAGKAARRAMVKGQLARLKALDRAGLPPGERVGYDAILYALESQAAIDAFPFGGVASTASPYVLSQQTGAYQDIPDFLDTKHLIETGADADAYLARLSAFARQLDDDTDAFRRETGMGATPPDFLLDLTLDQLRKTLTYPESSVMVASITRRAAAKGLPSRYGQDATKIYVEAITPALQRQIEAVRKARAGAVHDAGVWRIKDGEAWYQAGLRASTTTSLSPDEIHQLGLDQAKALSSRLDALLKAQGLSKGTVGERIKALYADPKQLYPNTDAGKQQAIAYGNMRLDQVRPLLPKAFSRLPSYTFEVRRVPLALEAGAAVAYSQGPALDGSRPGFVYINLHDSADWPRFALATAIFHEGLPGHQLEGGLALSNPQITLLQKTAGFSAYAEGWGLYAEQLADELGVYADDPLGRIGYLKFQLFRANRMVVDTGLHHLRWGREKAAAYFVEQEGETPLFASREVERYCTQPGQACSYKLGHSTIVDLRDKAQKALGPRFDIKAFHDMVLAHGRIPLETLKSAAAEWMAKA